MSSAVFSCAGKVSYDSAKAALDVGKRTKKRGHKSASAYRCTVCGSYHLGHSTSPKKAGKFRYESGIDTSWPDEEDHTPTPSTLEPNCSGD